MTGYNEGIVRDPIWTYWEDGKPPPHINLCLQSMRIMWEPNLTVITQRTAPKFIGNLLHSRWLELPSPAIRSAALRVALVARHGGWWVDADTVPVAPKLPSLHEDLVYTDWGRKHRALNGYFGAPKGCKAVKVWLDSINHILANHFSKRKTVAAWWSVLGEVLLTYCVTVWGGQRVKRKTFIPFDFDKDPQGFLRNGHWRRRITSDTLCFALNNSWLTEHAGAALAMPVDEQLDSPLLIHSILNHARDIISGHSSGTS